MVRSYKNRSFANMCARTTLKSRIRRLSRSGISYWPTRQDVVDILERNRKWNSPKATLA